MTKFTDQQLIENHSKGMTDAELVSLFGVTRQAIQQRREKLGIAGNKKPKAIKPVCRCSDCDVAIYQGQQRCRKCSAILRLRERKHHAALLDISQILPIFEARASGDTVKEIAKRFKVKPITIYVVLQRKKWAHVPIPGNILAKVRATRSPRS